MNSVKSRNTKPEHGHLHPVKRGWSSLVLWECETKRPATIERKRLKFLGGLVRRTLSVGNKLVVLLIHKTNPIVLNGDFQQGGS